MSKIGCAALLAVGIGGAGEAVAHEMPCWEREKVLDRIPRNLGQTPAFVGLIDSDKLLEVWISPTGEWTAAISYASGLFCVFSGGSGWRPVVTMPTGEDG